MRKTLCGDRTIECIYCHAQITEPIKKILKAVLFADWRIFTHADKVWGCCSACGDLHGPFDFTEAVKQMIAEWEIAWRKRLAASESNRLPTGIVDGGAFCPDCGLALEVAVFEHRAPLGWARLQNERFETGAVEVCKPCRYRAVAK